MPTIMASEADFIALEGQPIAFHVDLDICATVREYRWDFDGDGEVDFTSQTSPNTTHTFSTAGIYNAVLEVVFDDMTERSFIYEIRIEPVDQPPRVTVTRPDAYHETDRLTPVHFDGTATDDGEVVLWEWDFDGDGTFDWNSTEGAAVDHLYTELGDHTAFLRATDDGGSRGIDGVLVAILNIPPSFTHVSNVITDNVQVSLNVSVHDPDGDVITLMWDFGDDTSPLTTPETEVSHLFPGTGRYWVGVSAEDDVGGVSTTTLRVDVLEPGSLDPPTVDVGPDLEVVVGQAVQLEAMATAGSLPIVEYSWDLDGDGEMDVQGRLATHVFEEVGAHSVRVRVEDEGGLSAEDRLTVTVVPEENAPPVPRPSVEQWVRPGRNLWFREQSHDPDGTIVLYRWDFDGDGVFDYSNSSNGNTTHVYIEEGLYVAVLQVTDNRGEVATATVNIEVSTDAPGEEEVDDTKGAAICCAVTAVAMGVVAYWTMRRSLATPRRDGGPGGSGTEATEEGHEGAKGEGTEPEDGPGPD